MQTVPLNVFGSSDLLSALGIDVRLLVIQAASFLVLVVLLAKFAYPTILKSIETQRAKVEDGLSNAKKAEEKLKAAEQQSADIIRSARKEAEEIAIRTQKEAAELIEMAEIKALKRAKTILDDAHIQIESETAKARTYLRKEAAGLVAQTAEKVIREKVDSPKDAQLISSLISEAE